MKKEEEKKMKYDESFKLEIDNTLYYKDLNSEKRKKKIKCANCKKYHIYDSGEMVYKHNNYSFCSYPCRSKWRKAHPFARPHNPHIMTTDPYFFGK